jgi:hypothetical protein
MVNIRSRGSQNLPKRGGDNALDAGRSLPAPGNMLLGVKKAGSNSSG